MKKCPYCAEEIQDEAVKCKHCGSDLSGKNPAPAKKTSRLTTIGCAALIGFVLLLVIAGLLSPTPKSTTSQSTPPPPISAEAKAEADKLIKAAMHAGIIDKFNCNNVPKEVPSVYVDEPAWQGMTLDAKKNLAITAGVNCGSWNAVVYSAQTGKELAYYTEKYGFNFFK